MDDIHERADRMLGYVRDSLRAATSPQRPGELDVRLNQATAALTTTAVVSFAVDAAGHLIPDTSFPARLVVVRAVVGPVTSGLMWLLAPIRSHRSRREGRDPRALG